MQPNSNNQNTNNQNTKKTINEKELEILKYWQENKIFQKSVESPAGKDFKKEARADYCFYDGPPFATGMPHHGHILAGTIKDSIPRYHTMQGKSVRRVWGWDCHGLPIENLVEKEFGLNSKKDIESFGVDKFNQAAANSVLTYESEWKKIVPRLGRWVDMDNPYKTMDWTFTESVWWAWKQLHDKGLVYEGSKMMHICPRCETPLAQSEVGLEYNDVTDISVTAEFELIEDSPSLVKRGPEVEPLGLTYILAWTTTPWTLPGNTALAVNKDIVYVKVKAVREAREKYFILAKSRYEEYKTYAKDYASFEIVEEFLGEKLVGKSYKPLFDYYKDIDLENKENIWKVWHADFITDDAGTGIAHEAPAFGADDMELAKQNNIPVIKHVKMNGHFTDEVKDFAGMVVKKKDDTMSTDIEIIKWLAHNGKLFEKHKLVHSYPLCWRCKTPLLNYATSSWFVDVPAIKDKLISENQKVGWVPENIKDGRFGKWLEGAREWAVSRSRYWGAPMPIWKSVDGMETKVVGSLEEIAQPAKNTYYVMRHGESFSNVNMVIDNGNDIDNHITEKGRVQVEDAAKNFKDNIDLIISSPVLRTRETSDIFARAKGVEVIYDDRVKEFDHGIYDRQPLKYFLDKEGRENYLKFNNRPEGGETHKEMMNRCMSLIQDLEKENVGKSILIVTHGGPMRMMIAGAELITEEHIIADELSHDIRLYPHNAEIRKLNYKRVPRDETGAINLHKPYIDKFTLTDSRGVEMRVIGDVFDCWFESGSMPYAQLHYPFENVETFKKNFPADFIAEGMDQTRGWFYSLINLGVGLFGETPYKHVIVNGVVMAGDGRKMSKSEKNYTDPMILVEKYGADAFRFALMNSPVMSGESVAFGDEMIEEVYKKNVQRLENIMDFYLMYRDSPSPWEKGLGDEALSNNILDKWIITRLAEVINTSIKGYEFYRLDTAVSKISDFIDDLSTWYLRRSRERMKDGDVEALASMQYVLIEFAKVIAPSMPFIAERVYQSVANTTDSVHLQSYPKEVSLGEESENILKEMKEVRDVVTDLLMLRQKQNVPVRQPLQSATINKNIEEKYFEIIKEELNVKNISTDLESDNSLDFELTPELVREGKQRELSREIKDKRKELGLVATNSIILTIDQGRMELLDEDYKTAMNIKQVHIGNGLYVDKI